MTVLQVEKLSSLLYIVFMQQEKYWQWKQLETLKQNILEVVGKKIDQW